jgi:hypothetical protein
LRGAYHTCWERWRRFKPSGFISYFEAEKVAEPASAEPLGTIEIRLPRGTVQITGRVELLTLQHGDREFAPMIGLPAGTRIWIVAGVTDLLRGFVGLSGVVQTALDENP